MKTINCKNNKRNISFENALLLLFSYAFSKIGNIVFDYGNSKLLLTFEEKAKTLLAIYQGSESFVALIFILLGGILADIYSKKKLITLCDLLSGFVCFLLFIFIDSKYMSVLLLSANLLLSVFSSLESSAHKSISKSAIQKENLPKYNSIYNVFSETIRILGPLIALLIVNSKGAKSAILINSISFFISSLLKKHITVEDEIYQNDSKKKESIFLTFIDGFKYIKRHKGIFMIIMIASITNLFLAGYNLSLPLSNTFIVSKIDPYSILLASEAIGGMIGSFVNYKLPLSKTYNNLVMYLAISAIFLVLVPFLYTITKMAVIVYILISLFNCFLTIFNIQYITKIQNDVDDTYLSRVFSFVFAFATLLSPIGSLVFSNINFTIEIYYIIGFPIIILALLTIIINAISFNKTKIN